MRHFRDVNALLEGLCEEAAKHDCTIRRRDGRIFAVVTTTCECGAETVHEIDLTAAAIKLWEVLS